MVSWLTMTSLDPSGFLSGSTAERQHCQKRSASDWQSEALLAELGWIRTAVKTTISAVKYKIC